MHTCTICPFETELDDVVVAFAAGGCVCLRCYGRETGSARPMPKARRCGGVHHPEGAPPCLVPTAPAAAAASSSRRRTACPASVA